MMNSLLFRWEDSQALQHHCGFCERPLSHPGARASCFGTHSEPCHRFHQAMFMRNRAHICNYCSTIDEAHYKRHHDLVTQLRNIYESCGEGDWTIVPVEPGDPTRDHSSDTQTANGEVSDRFLTPEETTTSKRERKDAKCLARAASRTKPVTQEEIRYADSVLHFSGDVAGGDDASPANLDEIQLIEENLRYNANVYNSHSSRKALKQFAKIPEVDVDFGVELDRVLHTFRVTELVKRNLRNRGLQGKALKTFENQVDAFRIAVVEDLVLVKKDMMEIRMRRAGYLRYTNKTSYGIVEDRYTEKDWKTGERIATSASEFSGLSSPSEELVVSHSIIPAPSPSIALSTTGPDRRHLQHVHTRVSGNDGLDQKVIEPYHAPLLSLTPNVTPRRSAVLQLKVIGNKENRIAAGMTNRGWLRRDVARQIPFDQPLVAPEEDKLPPSPTVKSVVAKTTSTRLKTTWCKTTDTSSAGQNSPKADEFHFPSLDTTAKKRQCVLIYSDPLAVQPPAVDVTTSLQGPERLMAPTGYTNDWHPVVSQKKTKKSQREAKRKARKVSESPEETLSPTTEEEAGFEQAAHDLCKTSSSSSVDDNGSHVVDKMSPQSPNASIIQLTDSGKDDISIIAVREQFTVLDASPEPSLNSTPRSTYGKHDHWIRFVRVFTVDQLTAPLLQSFEGCSHGSSCQFESHGVPDCPFHEPHCPCVDPLLNQCYLVYPSKQPCTSGPYNRAQGQRLMAIYEQQDLTKGRVMLVDDGLVPYLLDPHTSPTKPDLGDMPLRLLREHTEFMEGYERGPLMKQEVEFERLFFKNMAMRHQLTTKMLRDIQRQNDYVKGSAQLCYCKDVFFLKDSEIRKELSNGIMSCSYRKCKFGGVFHKRCVKKLGVEKLSRWYCTACEKKMKMWAYKALNIPYDRDDDFKDFTDEEKLVTRMVVAELTQLGGTMDRFKSHL